MSATILFVSSIGLAPKLDKLSQTLITNLNIASAVVAILTLALAAWCRLFRCSAHMDEVRCRVIMAFSLSTSLYSISQLALSGKSPEIRNLIGIRTFIFISTFSLVLNGLLISFAIGLDTAIRYGLRSFKTAKRMSDYYEISCFVLALIVSQPMLYIFREFLWTGSAVVMKSSMLAMAGRVEFDVVVWMFESAWITVAMVFSSGFIGFALVKTNKIANCLGNGSTTSLGSMLGTVTSIQSRVGVSACYVMSSMCLLVWRPVFRITGSQSPSLLRILSVCESLQAFFILLIFIMDYLVNIRRPSIEWLDSSGNSIESGSYSAGQSLTTFEWDKSFTTWRNPGFVECYKSGSTVNGRQNKGLRGLPTTRDIRLWMDEMKTYRIQSDIHYYDDDNCSISNTSFERVSEQNSQPMVMYPLNNYPL